MKISVKVITSAKENSVTVKDEIYTVRVTIAPDRGKANEAVIKLLAAHFEIPKSQIKIIRGQTTRDKIIEIRGSI